MLNGQEAFGNCTVGQGKIFCASRLIVYNNVIVSLIILSLTFTGLAISNSNGDY